MSKHLIDLTLLRMIKERSRPDLTLGELKLLSAELAGKTIDIDSIEPRCREMVKRGWLSTITIDGVHHFWLIPAGHQVLRDEPKVARDKPGLTNR